MINISRIVTSVNEEKKPDATFSLESHLNAISTQYQAEFSGESFMQSVRDFFGMIPRKHHQLPTFAGDINLPEKYETGLTVNYRADASTTLPYKTCNFDLFLTLTYFFKNVPALVEFAKEADRVASAKRKQFDAMLKDLDKTLDDVKKRTGQRNIENISSKDMQPIFEMAKEFGEMIDQWYKPVIDAYYRAVPYWDPREEMKDITRWRAWSNSDKREVIIWELEYELPEPSVYKNIMEQLLKDKKKYGKEFERCKAAVMMENFNDLVEFIPFDSKHYEEYDNALFRWLEFSKDSNKGSVYLRLHKQMGYLAAGLFNDYIGNVVEPFYNAMGVEKAYHASLESFIQSYRLPQGEISNEGMLGDFWAWLKKTLGISHSKAEVLHGFGHFVFPKNPSKGDEVEFEFNEFFPIPFYQEKDPIYAVFKRYDINKVKAIHEEASRVIATDKQLQIDEVDKLREAIKEVLDTGGNDGEIAKQAMEVVKRYCAAVDKSFRKTISLIQSSLPPSDPKKLETIGRKSGSYSTMTFKLDDINSYAKVAKPFLADVQKHENWLKSASPADLNTLGSQWNPFINVYVVAMQEGLISFGLTGHSSRGGFYDMLLAYMTKQGYFMLAGESMVEASEIKAIAKHVVNLAHKLGINDK